MSVPLFDSPFRGQRVRGFTLVEMLITLSVFVLLSAAIFGIVTSVLTSAQSLQTNQDRGDQVMALNAFLKNQLEGLPGQSVLVSYRRGDGDGLVLTGILFGTNGFLTAIDAKIQSNGLYTLRLATYTPPIQNANSPVIFQQAITDDDDASLVWTSLIRDVQHITWKFQVLNSAPWLEQWTNLASKPNIVELSLQIAGDTRPDVMDLWIPPIYAPPSSTHVP